MKMYASVEITKGWDIWNKMAEDLNYDIGLSGWDEFIYKGWDMDEKNSYDLGI